MSVLAALGVLGAGALGAVLRYCASRIGRHRPVLTLLLVNTVGCAVAGIVLGVASRDGVASDVQLILATGFCGGLTTFSTWSTDTIRLALSRRWWTAAANVGATLGLGLLAATIGYIAAR